MQKNEQVNQTVRAFFAIEMPEYVKRAINEISDQLRKQDDCQELKWVKSESLHITLCFLGNISELQVQCAIKKAAAALQNYQPIPITLNSLLPFPSHNKPHALILLPEPVAKLTSLALIINEQVANCGIPIEKRAFRPHLTIARISNNACPNLEKIKLPKIAFNATSVKLIQSRLTTKGSIYTTRWETNFNMAAPLPLTQLVNNC